ncbi:Crp/Fnr family transcriptional regulator [Elizabethkingia meningoseptica]|uniref:Crp/Fnr family transcriptional regulator n=1 Tax=Elizabethkingia meningoseptica TaxID=238 RepID=UPI0038927379
MRDFIEQINSYYPLSEETANALEGICKEQFYKKNELLQRSGETARYYYFIRKGLVGYYTLDETGENVYKMFFAEKSFPAATVSIIKEEPGDFNIVALEDCEVIKYPAKAYRQLLLKYHDLALFHIHYLEQNWVVKKEPLEISLKHETAKQRYIKLLEEPDLYRRLKQHHIASYLGVTPTQLSRIRKEIKS